MRLIIWNCKGAFHRKHAFVAALRPDILIVPECEKLSGLSQLIDSPPLQSLEWFGTNPRKGLGVFSYGEYVLKVHPSYDASHKWIVPLSVSGPAAFLLFAVWTVPFGNHSSLYVRSLFEALETYKSVINLSEVIWAGDFNSNFVFDTPKRKYKFRDFVNILGEYGLHSLYHHQRKCDHGAEPEKTFYLHHNSAKGYHIDYVFATDAFQTDGISVSVGSCSDWLQHSDHTPLVCDLLLVH